MTKVLCDMKDCVYYQYKPNEGEAYQDQCDNDEIDIGSNLSGKPQCFSYEKEKK